MPRPGALRPSRVGWLDLRKFSVGGIRVLATVGDLNKLAAVTASADELNRASDALYAAPGLHLLRVAKAQYDFAALGGEVGAINLGVELPKDAIVLDGLLQVVTALASDDAATVGVQLEAAGDIVAAGAIANAPWSAAGLKAVIPDGTAAKAVTTTAKRGISVVIGAADLTAGKFNIFLRYVVGD